MPPPTGILNSRKTSHTLEKNCEDIISGITGQPCGNFWCWQALLWTTPWARGRWGILHAFQRRLDAGAPGLDSPPGGARLAPHAYVALTEAGSASSRA